MFSNRMTVKEIVKENLDSMKTSGIYDRTQNDKIRVIYGELEDVLFKEVKWCYSNSEKKKFTIKTVIETETFTDEDKKALYHSFLKNNWRCIYMKFAKDNVESIFYIKITVKEIIYKPRQHG